MNCCRFSDIIKSIVSAENYQTAIYRVDSLLRHFWPKRRKMNFPKEQIRLVRKLILDFQDNQEYLLNYLKYPHLNIPHTTNLIEGLNSQLELRLASIRGFENEDTTKNYLNAL
jgi:transposase-like protein